MPGLDPGTHVFLAKTTTWMAGTSPATTGQRIDFASLFVANQLILTM
jgi:hypothetical protein